jgi:NTE family protein
MKTTELTDHPQVFQIIRELKQEGIEKRAFSDVIDDQGNQYIELVMEGGGVLGVALIGYTYVLEKMGLRFFSLAGTSAGSINAMLLAAFGDISQPKGEKLIKVLANKNLYDFVDGDSDAKDFIHSLVEKAGRVKLVFKGMQIIDNITQDLGLNPGNNFLNWLSGILRENGVKNTGQLSENFGAIPAGLKIRAGVNGDIAGLKPRLAFIASDLTTETKVEFPKMGSLYWKKPDEVNPALYVRASMSIPYFFHPLVVKSLPIGQEALARWDDLASYLGEIPKEVHFVDGGLLSNFPIDVFHSFNSVPRLPTFGVRLGVDRNKPNTINNPMNLFGAMFNSIRHLHDYDFILRNPDYKHLVQNIDIGPHDWLNFGITDEAKKDLFYRGALAAAQFLRKFNWDTYKQLRSEFKVPVK